MSSAILFFQNAKWPVFKVLSVLLLGSLLLRDALWWDILLDDRVIQPFLLLLTPPALFAAVRRQNPVWALIACSVPAGIAVGVFNLMEPLFDFDESAAIASPLVYAPVALGLVLAYALRVIASPYGSQAEPTGLGFVVCFFLTVASAAMFLLFKSGDAEMYLHMPSFQIASAVIVCSFAFNNMARLTFGEVMARGGLFSCLLAAVYAITLYTAGAASENPGTSGPTLVTSFILLAVGALVVIAASASGVKPHEDRELMTRDWHLTEAYVFVTLIVFPPLSLLELYREFFSG